MSLMDHRQPWFQLVLILILVTNSKGETWGVNVTRSFTAERGKSVTIPCTFSVPPQEYHENIQLFWKVPVRSTFNTYDRDGNAFIFHPNRTFVLKEYQGKTELLGQRNGQPKNCTLRISHFMNNQLRIYLRIIGKTNNYTFGKNIVTISVSGKGVLDKAEPVTGQISQTLNIAIFVPLAALFILLASAAGFVVWRKQSRSQSLVRECSGYYANFSRASSNQATRKENCQKKDNKKLSDVKVIDEPVYINMQHPTGQLKPEVDQERGHKESIYANVDHYE
uniref:myelin-associated glycoprotein-like isoform X2 n=1 Tax=Doryrhamphus excisus TaxID=161450 RepID=UPI0025ADDB4E|nr:myelin-associated glycoprotein-like isoform X2 [Doryrhamphus excisus]